MTSHDRMRDTRTRKPIIAPDRALPTPGTGRRRPTIFEVDLGGVAPRLAATTDRWGPALATLALVALAAGIAGWLLLPALDTLAGTSVITWTGEGP